MNVLKCGLSEALHTTHKANVSSIYTDSPDLLGFYTAPATPPPAYLPGTWKLTGPQTDFWKAQLSHKAPPLTSTPTLHSGKCWPSPCSLQISNCQPSSSLYFIFHIQIISKYFCKREDPRTWAIICCLLRCRKESRWSKLARTRTSTLMWEDVASSRLYLQNIWVPTIWPWKITSTKDYLLIPATITRTTNLLIDLRASFLHLRPVHKKPKSLPNSTSAVLSFSPSFLPFLSVSSWKEICEEVKAFSIWPSPKDSFKIYV